LKNFINDFPRHLNAIVEIRYHVKLDSLFKDGYFVSEKILTFIYIHSQILWMLSISPDNSYLFSKNDADVIFELESLRKA
jgi:hypothetical protein